MRNRSSAAQPPNHGPEGRKKKVLGLNRRNIFNGSAPRGAVALDLRSSASMKGNVYLTGFMGTGKTAVGRALAWTLKWPFVDTDAWIEDHAGATVAQIFSRSGERFFRKLERRALRVAVSKPGRVVALGGGALLDRRNLTLVARAGQIVHLRCGMEALWRRLKKEIHARPLLRTPDAKTNFLRLLKRREAIRLPGAWTVTTTTRAPEAVARLIAARLRKEGLCR